MLLLLARADMGDQRWSTGPIGTAAPVHLDAAIPNLRHPEFCVAHAPWVQEVVAGATGRGRRDRGARLPRPRRRQTLYSEASRWVCPTATASKRRPSTISTSSRTSNAAGCTPRSGTFALVPVDRFGTSTIT